MSNNILFLCQHGGAKSVIAATYFNAGWTAATPVAALERAEEKATTGVAAVQTYTAVAASTDEPYDAVPEPVAKLLGIRDFTPRRVTPEDVAHAARIIAIECELEGAERWDDVPKVSEDLEGAAAAIRRHVDALIAELRG